MRALRFIIKSMKIKHKNNKQKIEDTKTFKNNYKYAFE